MAVWLEDGGRALLMNGPTYFDVLARLHQAFAPRSYLEVGTLHGDTLGLASCPSVAVDPQFQLRDEALRRPGMMLFEQTSDDFFASHDPVRLLARRIDLAFLDGMHQFDFLLRDFVNAERSCAPGSMIVLHDCLPGDDWMTRPASRSGETAPTLFPGWWTGDVWKMVPVLREARPDLRITCLDALPTGLVVIAGLNPGDRTLDRRMDALVGAWAPVRLADYSLSRLLEEARPVAAEPWLETVRPVSRATRLKRQAKVALSPALTLARRGRARLRSVMPTAAQ